MDRVTSSRERHVPKDLNFNLTWRCNLKCRMCNNAQQHDPDGQELSGSQIISIAKAYNDVFDIEKVRFWGGEPFLRPDLVRIIRGISPFADTLVITNGTLITESLAMEIVHAGLKYIEFSIDMPKRHHDMLRGDGTYDKSLNGLRLLQQAKQKAHSATPHVTIRPLITKLNFHLFADLFQIVENSGFEFQFVFLRDWYDALTSTKYKGHPIGYYQPGRDNERNPDVGEIVLNPGECDSVWEKYFDLSRNGNKKTVDYRRWLRRFTRILKSFVYTDCTRSKNNVLVDPYGYLYPCELLNYKYGQTLKDGPRSWYSAKRQQIRSAIMHGDFPICMECNRYGHKRPLLSIYIYLLKYIDYYLLRKGTLPKLQWFRLKRGRV